MNVFKNRNQSTSINESLFYTFLKQCQSPESIDHPFFPSLLPCSHRRDSTWWIRWVGWVLCSWRPRQPGCSCGRYGPFVAFTELNIGKLEVILGYYWEVTTEELKLGLTQGWEWTFYCHPLQYLSYSGETWNMLIPERPIPWLSWSTPHVPKPAHV